MFLLQHLPIHGLGISLINDLCNTFSLNYIVPSTSSHIGLKFLCIFEWKQQNLDNKAPVLGAFIPLLPYPTLVDTLVNPNRLCHEAWLTKKPLNICFTIKSKKFQTPRYTLNNWSCVEFNVERQLSICRSSISTKMSDGMKHDLQKNVLKSFKRKLIPTCNYFWISDNFMQIPCYN
jgi:hypothetical protein